MKLLTVLPALLLVTLSCNSQSNQEILKKERKRINELSNNVPRIFWPANERIEVPMVRKVSVEGKEYLVPAFQCSHRWVELLEDTIINEGNFTDKPVGGPYREPAIPNDYNDYEYTGTTLICLHCRRIRQQVVYYERARAYRKQRDKTTK